MEFLSPALFFVSLPILATLGLGLKEASPFEYLLVAGCVFYAGSSSKDSAIPSFMLLVSSLLVWWRVRKGRGPYAGKHAAKDGAQSE